MTAIKYLTLLFYLWVELMGFVTSVKAESPIDGKYYWESGSDEKVKKYVDLAVRTTDGNVVISVDLVWTPGAHVEMGGTARSTDVTTEVGPDGNTIYKLLFTLADGFNNKGVGRLILSGDNCLVTFTSTEEADSRATRQYGEYTLTRRAPDAP